MLRHSFPGLADLLPKIGFEVIIEILRSDPIDRDLGFYDDSISEMSVLKILSGDIQQVGMP